MQDAGRPAKFGPVLEGNSALVTGAGQGLGRGIAIALARAGALVAVVDLNPATAREVAEELGEHGEPGLAVECDVSERDQVEHAVERTAAELGGLDVLVNNAQDLRGVQKSFMDTDEAHLRQHLDSGLLGTYHFLQASYPHLKARRGAVVNIGSGAGVMGLAEHFSYAVTKESIRATTRVVAREWGPDGIRVNAVCPAAYDTPRWSTSWSRPARKAEPRWRRRSRWDVSAGRKTPPRSWCSSRATPRAT